MPTIPTQNAVPSEAARDLKFNAGKIDEFVTSLEHEYKDRFGRCHMTIEGMRWIFEQLMERFKVDIDQAIIAAGYIPMDSFQQGAEITRRNEILRDETTGEYYRWDGDLPKSIPAGSTPESAGGVGMGAWVSIGDASLRTELSSDNGAGMIGALDSNGRATTVQVEIDNLNRNIHSKHRKSIIASWNWGFPDYEELKSIYSYSILVPQGLAIDADYYYVGYATNESGGVNKWFWIAVYRRFDSSYIGCFSIPNTTSYCESIYVRNYAGKRIIYTTADSMAVGYDISQFPVNKGPVETKIFEYKNCASFAPSKDGLTIFRSDHNDRMLVTIDWSGRVKGVAVLPESAHSLSSKQNPYRQTRGKVQARTMFHGEMIMVGCARYDSDDINNSLVPLNAPFYMTINSSGVVTEHYFYNPDFFLSSIDSVQGKNVLENEGIAVSPEGRLYTLWYTDGAGPTTIKIIEEFSTSDDAVDFSSGLTETMAAGIKDSSFVYYNTSWVNPYTNQRFNSVDDIFSMILQLDIKYSLSFYTNSIFNVEASGAHKVPAGTLMTFKMMSDSTVYIDFVGSRYRNSAVSSVIGSYIFGNVQTGGSVGDSILTSDCVVLAPGGVGAIHTKRDTTSGALHYSFFNPNGSVGSIVTSGTSTSYNTTSDINLKIDKGEIKNPIDVVKSIVESGAVRYASYKNEPDNIMPMYMAQILNDVAPYAVSKGVGNPGDLDYMPWGVDYSKLTPILIAAIYQLSKKV